MRRLLRKIDALYTRIVEPLVVIAVIAILVAVC